MANTDIDDLQERQRTFSAFLRLIRWSIAAIAVALIVLFFVVIGNPYA
jgi:hypothetical protein